MAELEQLRSSFAWKTVASVVRAIDAVPASSAGNCKLTVLEKCRQLAFLSYMHIEVNRYSLYVGHSAAGDLFVVVRNVYSIKPVCNKQGHVKGAYTLKGAHT